MEINRQVAALAGTPLEDVLSVYFERLVTAISSQRAGLRKWLKDHKISDSFKANGRAPMTDEKAIMVGMGISEEQLAVQDALDMGGVGVTKDLFSSSALRTLMQSLDDTWSINTKAVPKLYEKLGFTRIPKKLWWDGSAHSIWMRGHKKADLEWVKKVLDSTIVDRDLHNEFF